jgi:hypothetical protein
MTSTGEIVTWYNRRAAIAQVCAGFIIASLSALLPRGSPNNLFQYAHGLFVQLKASPLKQSLRAHLTHAGEREKLPSIGAARAREPLHHQFFDW